MARTKQTARKCTGALPSIRKSKNTKKEKERKLNLLPFDIKTNIVLNEQKKKLSDSKTDNTLSETDNIDLSTFALNKHPIVALFDYSSQKRWNNPKFSLVEDKGPAAEEYLIKVCVNSVDYQPQFGSSSENLARKYAAIEALQALGMKLE